MKSPNKGYIHDPTFRHSGLVSHQGWSDVETHDLIYCQGDVIYQPDVNILVVNYFRHPYLGYVHTVTFLHGFVLFHNPKGIPIYFQTIENDAKTLPCAHSLKAQGLASICPASKQSR